MGNYWSLLSSWVYIKYYTLCMDRIIPPLRVDLGLTLGCTTVSKPLSYQIRRFSSAQVRFITIFTSLSYILSQNFERLEGRIQPFCFVSRLYDYRSIIFNNELPTDTSGKFTFLRNKKSHSTWLVKSALICHTNSRKKDFCAQFKDIHCLKMIAPFPALLQNHKK